MSEDRFQEPIPFPPREFWESNAGRQTCSTSVFTRRATSPATDPVLFVRPPRLSFGGNRNRSPTHCAEGFAHAQSQSGETVHAAEGSDWTREAEARSWTSGDRSPGKSGSMEEAPHGELVRDAWVAGRWDRAALTVPLSPCRLPRSRQRPGGPSSLVPGMPQPEAVCVGRRRRSGPG